MDAPRDLPIVSVNELYRYVGQEIGTSDWVTIEQRDIDDFARLTRDDQLIHIDRERAARERGGTVAHGFLTLSFLSYLARSISFRIAGVTHGVNYGFDKLSLHQLRSLWRPRAAAPDLEGRVAKGGGHGPHSPLRHGRRRKRQAGAGGGLGYARLHCGARCHDRG